MWLSFDGRCRFGVLYQVITQASHYDSKFTFLLSDDQSCRQSERGNSYLPGQNTFELLKLPTSALEMSHIGPSNAIIAITTAN